MAETTLYLFDGYNLLHASEYTDPNDLVDLLASFVAANGARGVIVFDGPQGHGFFKGGHDGQTANTMVCIETTQRCVVILSNDVRSEVGFADLIKLILGETAVPYYWEYGDRAGKS